MMGVPLALFALLVLVFVIAAEEESINIESYQADYGDNPCPKELLVKISDDISRSELAFHTGVYRMRDRSGHKFNILLVWSPRWL